MAVTKGAKKAHEASLRKRIFNMRRKKAMKETFKSIENLLEAGKKDEAKTLLPEAYKAVDKAAKQGIIKENTASRKKSRLARMTN